MKKLLCLCLTLLMLGVTPALSEDWTCPACDHAAGGNFCSECGAAKPIDNTAAWVCPACGAEVVGKFCQSCGAAKPGTVIGTISEEVLARVAEAVAHVPQRVTPSPDKYTWYVSDYVGRNLAGIGYTSLGGSRMEAYGAGRIDLMLVTVDGTYVDISDEDALKQYVVIGQSPTADTEIKYVFEKNSDGQEYSSLINSQSVEQIDLIVARVDGRVYNDLITYEPVTFPAAPDRYTRYIRSYVGKNLAAIGYTSWGGDRMDSYGAARIKLALMTTDGSYVDVEDHALLASFVVTSQDIAPGAAMQLVYTTDSTGKEYSSLVDTQTYERITLTVSPITPAPMKPAAEDEEEDDEAEDASDSDDPPSAAAGTIGTSNGLTYLILEDGTAQITGYSGNRSHVSISTELDGCTVTQIGAQVFEGHTELTSVSLWADLTAIGDACFKDCTGLTHISLLGEMKRIGQSAFEGCTSLETVLLWGSPSIEAYAFKGCTALNSISIRSDTDFIGVSAFEGCTALKTVLLWGSPSIEAHAFKGCTALNRISIGSDTDFIGDSAFEGCTGLETVLLWGGTILGDSAFRGCTSLESISINSGTPSIGDYAFEGCSSLESAILWGSDTKVGKGAFDNCPKLDHVSQW